MRRFAVCAVVLSLAASAPDGRAQAASVGDRGMAIMSAVVDGGGVLLRGEGVVSAALSYSDPAYNNSYDVVFGRDVTQCAYAVTVFDETSGQYAVINVPSGSTDRLRVVTYAPDNQWAASTFYLLVYCGR